MNSNSVQLQISKNYFRHKKSFDIFEEMFKFEQNKKGFSSPFRAFKATAIVFSELYIPDLISYNDIKQL